MSDARKEPELGRAGDDSLQIQSHLRDSKERLQDELMEFFFQADEEAFCSGKLETLLDALDEVDPLPEMETDTEESLKRFHEKYASVFSAVEANTAAAPVSSPEKKHFRPALYKKLIAAAVLVLLLGSVTVQAFGWNVFGAIAHWTSEIFQMKDNSTPHARIRTNPLAEDEEVYYDTLEEAVEAFGITEAIVPKRLPERFKLTRVWATNKASGVIICADYVSGDEALQIRYTEVDNLNFSSLEQEDNDVEVDFKGKIKHYLLSDLGRQKAFWQNGELECRISGNITKQEMKDIVDSIYEGE